MTGINLSIVNVALPSISKDLHASVTGLQWTVDAFALVMACLLLLSGSMADRFGRKRISSSDWRLLQAGLMIVPLAVGQAAAARNGQRLTTATDHPLPSRSAAPADH